MEWLKRMADAVAYMEEHMEEPFDIADVARTACSSVFHFQRMFHMLTGATVAEYVRRRRLTLATQELAVAGAKVLEVALKYGYDTPESFAKAFRRVHGTNPSAAREPGANLKAYPRISFHLSLKGDKEMDYRIVEREAFQVVGFGPADIPQSVFYWLRRAFFYFNMASLPGFNAPKVEIISAMAGRKMLGSTMNGQIRQAGLLDTADFSSVTASWMKEAALRRMRRVRDLALQ